MLNNQDRAVGCMIGSAYGDSLGGAVEFMSLDQIKAMYGKGGITKLDTVFDFPPGSITDDTQMAIATAKGLLNQSDGDSTEAIWRAYLDWLQTQSQPGQSRAPGSTCLSALQSGKMGTLEAPLNHSAGCGAIMRAHPVGIAVEEPRDAFNLGMLSGVITHGHPNGYAPAGYLASLVSQLMAGSEMGFAVLRCSDYLVEFCPKDWFGTQNAITAALAAPKTDDPGSVIDAQVGQSSRNGGGWLGHDALAIAIYACVNWLDDPLQAVRVAVNHSGDSDSTGAIAGAILGTIYGPGPFLEDLDRQGVELEHEALLTTLALKLAASP